MSEGAGGSSMLMFPCSGSSDPHITISASPFGTWFWNLRSLNVRGNLSSNREGPIQLLWCQNFFFLLKILLGRLQGEQQQVVLRLEGSLCPLGTQSNACSAEICSPVYLP